MIDPIKAGTEISLDEPFRGASVWHDVAQGCVAPAVRAKPMRTGTELRLIIGVQDGTDHLLQELL